MLKTLLRAFMFLMAFTLLCGLIYPLTVTGLASAFFRHRAQGSLITAKGKTIGSALIGQRFNSPRYFHGRPSAAGAGGYDAAASGGSNLAPTNNSLLKTIAGRATEIRDENSLPAGTPIPGDLVTASASGLDPEISLDAAYLQIPRVAKARRLPAAEVRELVRRRIKNPQLGVLGESRVNVLELNLALDALKAGR